MSILLIRHGETPSNAARVVQHPDAPLSPRGEAQAERLADRLASQTVGRILSSDLRRAAQTAERLQAVTGAPLDWEPLLQERNFGEIRGTAYS
ncbi:MAG: histidine phosphatase family protein, partial [Myxococcota bacterium]